MTNSGSHENECFFAEWIPNNITCLNLLLAPDWLICFSSTGCPMSEWSVWSQCSCVSQRQQRYRVALSPATRGQQCTPVETQSRTCSLSHCDGELTTMVKKKSVYESVWTKRPVYDPFIVLMLKVHLNFLFLPLTKQIETKSQRTGNQSWWCLCVFGYVNVDTVQNLLYLLFFMFVDCEAPFVYSACGAPCEKQCALQGRGDLCLGVRECTPGCYCPQVNISLDIVYFLVYTRYAHFAQIKSNHTL